MDHITLTIVESELPVHTHADPRLEPRDIGIAIMRWRIRLLLFTAYEIYPGRWPANFVLLNISLFEDCTRRSLPTVRATLSGIRMPIAFAVNQERRARTTVSRASLKRGCDATIASNRRIPLKNHNIGRAATHGLGLVPRVERTLKIGEWKRMTIQTCLD